MDVRLREAHFGDADGIAAVASRNGMVARSLEWLWRDNPAAGAALGQVPMGWVLEAGTEIVGYLGNVPLVYHRDGRQLVAAAAKAYAVDAAFRSHSMRLAAAFLSQKGAAVMINTSANAPTGRIFGALRAKPVPVPELDIALMWLLDAREFLRAMLEKRGRSRVLAGFVASLAAPIAAAALALRQRSSHRHPIDVRPLDLQALGAAYEDFWQRVLGQNRQRLLADRSAAALKWHLAHPAVAQREARMLGAWRGDALVGYVVLTREDSPDVQLRRLRLTDLMAQDDEPAVIEALVAGALEAARNARAHLLEALAFPPHVRHVLQRSRPLARHLPSWQFWYRANDPALASALTQPDAWYMTTFDGDASL